MPFRSSAARLSRLSEQAGGGGSNDGPLYISSSTAVQGGGTQNSIVIDKPLLSEIGDTVLLFAKQSNDVSTSLLCTGFSLLAVGQNGNRVFKRVLDGTEGSTFTINKTNDSRGTAVAILLRNVKSIEAVTNAPSAASALVINSHFASAPVIEIAAIVNNSASSSYINAITGWTSIGGNGSVLAGWSIFGKNIAADTAVPISNTGTINWTGGTPGTNPGHYFLLVT